MVSIRVLEPLRIALREAGFDDNKLLQTAGANLGLDGLVDYRLTESTAAEFCRLAVKQSGDPCFTLKAGMRSEPGSLGVLGYVLQNSRSVGDAWQHLQRFWQLLNDTPLFSIQQTGATSVLRFRQNSSVDAEARRPLVEYLLAFLLRLSGTLVGGSQRGADCLLSLQLRYAKPSAAIIACYRKSFPNAELCFAAEHNAIVFDPALFDRPVSYADAGMLEVMFRQAASEMDGLQVSHPIVNRVESVIRNCLPGQLPALPAVATECAMSRATLQRRLSAAGTNFKNIVDNVRHDLADQLLANKNYSTGEIAFALGYADTAAFHHAYKRWTGATPKQSRSKIVSP